jgi:hypothetical protein
LGQSKNIANSERVTFVTECQNGLVLEGLILESGSGSVVLAATYVHTPKAPKWSVAKRQDLTLAQLQRNGALSRVADAHQSEMLRDA